MSQSQENEDAIYAAAALLPATERATYLQEKCRADPLLRTRLEARLAAPPSPPPTATSISDDATIGSTFVTGGVLNRAPEEAPGDAIGRYTLIEVIGEGGCGLVYLAEQMEPVKRRVALKITKLGMDTRQVVARFEAERQALAMMDHPHIASVLDGGATAAGRPFFVMELVRGTKITHYCDQHRLSTRKRLRLFIQVCQAIEHAHQKGILHRDIKPSNILVAEHEGVAVCKVIDFGIAKATQGSLSDKTIYTQVDQFIGTPAYMSPEQAAMSGEDLDGRTDLYSLGVLLYELLTGYTPFESKGLLARGFDEMRRIIREMEPLRPSNRLRKQAAGELTNTATHQGTDSPRLINVVRGDLDWIVMKCLEKDRARRYGSAAELTGEIQRFLANEPIVARPPGNFYRFQKMVLRNRVAFAVGGVFFGTLIVGLCATIWYAVMERDARQVAERASQSADVLRHTAGAEKRDADESRLTALAALAESETNRLKAEASANEALLAKQEAETARKKAEDALQLADQERQKAEAAAELARQSKSAETAARADATTAESKSADAARAAALEAAMRQKAESARADAEAGRAAAETARAEAVAALDQAGKARVAAEAAATGARSESSNTVASIIHLISTAAANDPVTVLNLAVDYLLAPAAISNSTGPVAILRSAVESATNSGELGRSQLALSLLDYRLGHFAEAAEGADKATAASTEKPALAATASAVLALARQQLKQTNEASAALAKAVQVYESAVPKPEAGDVSRDWLVATVLLKEAKASVPSQGAAKTANTAQ